MQLTIVCWNIKDFSYSKASHSTVGPDIAKVFEDVDVGFILEAPAGELAAQLAASTVESNAGLKDSDAVDSGGLEGEQESVAVVIANGVQLQRLETMTGTWDSSIRSPVVADVKKASITCRIAVWHAPPPGKKDDLRAAAWPRVLQAAGNGKVDLLMGDFNAPLVAPRRGSYTCISEGVIYGTTLTNPALINVSSLSDIITSEAYDRVYRRDDAKVSVDTVALYLSPFPDLALPPRNATTRAEKKDPHRAYAMSDHLPVIVKVRKKA